MTARGGSFHRAAWFLLAACVRTAVAAEPCKTIGALDYPVVKPPAYRHDLPRAVDRVAVVGDVQRTSLEGCLIGNEVNDREQGILLADLSRQAPGAVLLLGDMAFDGKSDHHWAFFDHLMSASGLAGRPLFPLLGNHDYWLGSPDLHRVRQRFARLRLYAVTPGHAALRARAISRSRAGSEISPFGNQRITASSTRPLSSIRNGPGARPTRAPISRTTSGSAVRKAAPSTGPKKATVPPTTACTSMSTTREKP